jgi:hypothetical protein
LPWPSAFVASSACAGAITCCSEGTHTEYRKVGSTFSKVSGARRGEFACWNAKKWGMVFTKTIGLVTMQPDGDQRRFETAEYWHVRSRETRSRAEKMITPEARHLMLGLADDYERTASIVEGMASIRGSLGAAMATLYALLPQQ